MSVDLLPCTEKKPRLVWYVRFWDENTRRYAVTRSTNIPVGGKRQRRYEAEQAAREMLPSISFAPPAPEKPFVQYVADFWSPDSPYVKECVLGKKKPLSAAYVNMNHENVRRHMAAFPGFQNITLRGLTAGIIRDWITWAADNWLSGRVINLVLQGMRIPVRYAVMREEIPQDPFRNITNAPETHREKGILTPAEVSRLIAASERYPRTRLAVLLGLFCGMRRGEVRGLLWGDIGEGLKAPYESSRTVPIPGSVQLLLETVRAISGNPGALDFFIIPGVSLLRLIVIPYFFAGGGFLRRGNFPQRFYVFFQQLFFPAVYPACLPTAVFQLLSC